MYGTHTSSSDDESIVFGKYISLRKQGTTPTLTSPVAGRHTLSCAGRPPQKYICRITNTEDTAILQQTTMKRFGTSQGLGNPAADSAYFRPLGDAHGDSGDDIYMLTWRKGDVWHQEAKTPNGYDVRHAPWLLEIQL